MTSRRLVASFVLACAGLLLPAARAGEAPAPRYTTVTASPDGIGKVYFGREIARVMHFHGAPWLDRPERARQERPDVVLAALELEPGMAVADVGAGTGYYSWRIAQRVRPQGVVYAVEVQPEMLKMLADQMSRRGAANVKIIHGTASDPRLPAGTLDLALMVEVYHELEYPHEVLSAIVRALKPGGRVVFVEVRANDPAVPASPLHTMSEEQVRKEAAAHPLEWVRTVRDLPQHHAIVFRKVPERQGLPAMEIQRRVD